MANASIPGLLDALKSALAARTGLAGVAVRTAPLGVSDPHPGDVIVFLGVKEPVRQERAGFSNTSNRTEDLVLEGVIEAVKAGAGEDVAVVARNRAFELLGEIEDALRDNTLPAGLELRSYTFGQTADASGRIAQIPFQLADVALI